MSSGPFASRQTTSTSAEPLVQNEAPGAFAPGAAPGTAPWSGLNLLDNLLEAGVATAEVRSPLTGFLEASTVGEALCAWSGGKLPPAVAIAADAGDGDKRRDPLRSFLAVTNGLPADEVVRRLSHDIAVIDELLTEQVNAILHNPAFQRLEASWRGLKYLIDCAADEGEPNIKVKVLNASWRDLERDFERAIEFDQSQLFQKVYSEEFGMPGGEPYGMLIGDYEASPVRSAEHPHDDVAILKAISGVAAAAFCPFVTSASPAMFELDDFTQLENPMNLERTFDTLPYIKWRALRDSEDSRFMGLTLPRVLMRLPHDDDGSRTDRFRFVENVAGPDRSKYLWGNAAYAFGETVIRAYAQSGWPSDIRGVQRGVEGGGLVSRLPVHMFRTDRPGVAPKSVTDVVVTDQQEKDLAELGFIPLCHCHDTEYAAFYSSHSIQKPKKYEARAVAATRNAKLSSMLHYMLCVSQFSRYLKVIVRDKVGSYMDAGECQQKLDDWIRNYVTPDESASADVKARHPLREAKVEVRPHPGKPGSFLCTIHLWPHFELDELTASVKFKAELTPVSMG